MYQSIILILVLISTKVHSETWIQVDDTIECPDVIELNETSYVIFNDCYAFNPKEPIIESGSIKRSEGYIYFFERTIEQVSFIHNGNKPQKLKVVEKTIDRLSLKRGEYVFKFRKHTPVM